jgi:hypothetical protein
MITGGYEKQHDGGKTAVIFLWVKTPGLGQITRI